MITLNKITNSGHSVFAPCGIVKPIIGLPSCESDPAPPAAAFQFVFLANDDSLTMPTPQYLNDGTTPAVYDYYLDWGDGTPLVHITAWDQAEGYHEYTGLDGEMIVTITGRMDVFRMDVSGPGEAAKILDFLGWDGVLFKEYINMFKDCINMSYSAPNAPILATGAPYAHSLEGMFYNCGNFTGDSASGDFSWWDVSTITDFNNMFFQSGWAIAGCGAWDVSAGEIFFSMFEGTTAFDEDLSAWTPTAADPAPDPAAYSFKWFLYGATGFSVASYDLLLTAWSALTFDIADQSLNVNQQYTATAARAVLTGAPNNWSITDLGPV